MHELEIVIRHHGEPLTHFNLQNAYVGDDAIKENITVDGRQAVQGGVYSEYIIPNYTVVYLLDPDTSMWINSKLDYNKDLALHLETIHVAKR